MRNRGWTLIELLAVTALMGAVMLAGARVFRAALHETPAAARAIGTHCHIGRMLETLRADVDAARSLPQPAAGDKRLRIELPDGVVCYERQGDRVIRRKTPRRRSADEDAWLIGGADVEWQVWRRGGRRCAVEVRHWIRPAVAGQGVKKLANAHVFFLGAAPPRRPPP